METNDISIDVIEKITKATVLAFEQLKEVEKDAKAKSKRIKSLEFNLDIAQNNIFTLKQQYEEAECNNNALIEENKRLKETLMDMEIENTRKEGILEEKLDKERSTIEKLKLECQKLEKSNKLNQEINNKQKQEIELLNVENSKYKKITKKYAKTINTVSPQAVNNIRFVKKFPILESKCNTLIEKLEQTEKERDNLLSRIITGNKRPSTTTMDRNAQLMQQFSPANRTNRNNNNQHNYQQLQQLIPRQYVNNTSSSSSSPDAKKQKLL